MLSRPFHFTSTSRLTRLSSHSHWKLLAIPSYPLSVMVPPVTLAHKVDPELQDIQTRARRILAERNAEKAKEKTWIGRMVAAENINEMEALIKSRGLTN